MLQVVEDRAQEKQVKMAHSKASCWTGHASVAHPCGLQPAMRGLRRMAHKQLEVLRVTKLESNGAPKCSTQVNSNRKELGWGDNPSSSAVSTQKQSWPVPSLRGKGQYRIKLESS